MKTLLLFLCLTPLWADTLQVDQEMTASSGLQVLVMSQPVMQFPVLGLYSLLGPGVMVMIKNDTAAATADIYQVTVQRTSGRPVTVVFPRSKQPWTAYVVWVDPASMTALQVNQGRLLTAPAALGPAAEMEMVADPVEF